MKRLFLRRCLMLCLTAIGTATIGASTVTDVAWTTGLLSVAGPLGLQAASRSTLEVNVDVYRETIDLQSVTPQGGIIGIQKGRPPFALDEPLALRRRFAGLNAAADPVTSPTSEGLKTVEDQLAKAEVELREISAGLQSFAKRLEDFINANAAAKTKPLWEEVLGRRKAVESVVAEIVSYQRTLASALQDGVISADEQEVAANKLLSIRLASRVIEKDVSPLWLGLFQARLISITSALVAGAEAATFASDAGVVPASDLEFPSNNEDQSRNQTMQDNIWHTVRALRKVEANSGRYQDSSGKKLQLATATIADTKINLATLIKDNGFTGDPDRLFATETTSEFRLYWDGSFVVSALKRAAERANDATYVGVGVSVNFGPIANEVIQGILGQSRAIDEIISNENRWKTFNSARSHGGAGTHNAVIYFENMLTPVLKSATFDPSQLLLANAQMYKRATKVVAQVYGAPTSDDVTSGQADESLNLMNLESRARNATAKKDDKRAQLRAALGSLLEEQAKLSSLKNAATPADWADYNGTTRKHLTDLGTRLAGLAADLEKN